MGITKIRGITLFFHMYLLIGQTKILKKIIYMIGVGVHRMCRQKKSTRTLNTGMPTHAQRT